jgi:flagellar biosynthesis protein FlhF
MGPQKFIAANTAEALKLIRTELGSDAMVLSTKDTDQGVEIIAITSQDLANLSSHSESAEAFSAEVSPFSERSMAQSGLSDKFENAIARRVQSPEPKLRSDIPVGSLRRNPARAGRPIRAPGSEAFLPTSFNDVERIHRNDSSVINPSNNDAIFNASAAANAKAAHDLAALNAARVAAQNAAQAHRNSEAVLQKAAASSAPSAPSVPPVATGLSGFESAGSPKVEKLLTEISEVKYLLQSHVASNFWGSIQQENKHVTEIVKHLLNSGFSPSCALKLRANCQMI